MSDEIAVTEYIQGLVKRSRAAQRKFEREYTNQRAIDEVVRVIGMAVLNHQDEIAELAVSESKMGTAEEEKHKFMSIATANWNFLRGKPSVGEIPNIRPDEPGVRVFAKPLGIVGCVLPSTNPTGTVIGSGMAAIKARNSVIMTSALASERRSIWSPAVFPPTPESRGSGSCTSAPRSTWIPAVSWPLPRHTKRMRRSRSPSKRPVRWRNTWPPVR